MNLPSKISPNPLINSIVEIRFVSSLTPDKVLSSVAPILFGEFPNFETSNFPIMRDPPFQFVAGYVFSNDRFSVSVDNNVVSFENLKDYYGWTTYFELIKKVLKEVAPVLKPSKILRVASRYISLFDSPSKLSEYINIEEPFQFQDIISKNLTIENVFEKNGLQIRMIIAQNGSVRKRNLTSKKGMFIDLDASTVIDLPSNFDDDLFNVIAKTHDLEKSLFFKLLKPTFLNSLNPEYK